MPKGRTTIDPKINALRFRMSNEMYNAIEIQASKESCKMAEIIRKAVNQYLSK